jgi:L-glyceraldehyde 3-phosphate reductase
MKLRPLGSSGLLVSPICLGTMTFGSPVEEADAIKLTHGAIDLGVNFIDTANVYEGYDRYLGSSGGVAEVILGKALADRRDKVVLATKVGAPLGPGPQDAGLSPSSIGRELDASLKRLNTDYIDLYILHWPDLHTPLETTLSAIETGVRQGKIRSFGVSNHFAFDLCELLWIADKYGWPKPVSSQIPYSMLKRNFNIDLEFCDKHNIGVTPYQILEGGLLTGKYKRGQEIPDGSRMKENPNWIPNPNDTIYDQLEGTQALADEVGVPFSQYTVAWTLAQQAMTSMVIGSTKLQQIEDAVAGSDLTLSDSILTKQNEITPAPPRHTAPFSRPTE